MPDSLAEARRLLQHHFGYADFRPAQRPVIESVLQGRDTLAVLPTGGGKSICFQVPALVLGGLTIVVSPLISLMQDQVEAARARGLPAACLNSSLGKAEQSRVHDGITTGSLRLLYVSPERLDRLSQELQAARIIPRLLVVDEAHCIAEWGHDFRPSYRRLARARYRLERPPALALTGSATPDVRREIARALRMREGYALHLGSFDRPNLWFGAVRVKSEPERLEALLAILRGDDAMAIVYAPTRGVTEAVARALIRAGHRAAPYHAGLTKLRRSATLDDFLRDRVDVIVATCAFGMGIDKPNVRLVVHWTPPATPEAYYQEAGRAGRDGEFARCVLLWRPGDTALHRRQLDVTFPSRQLVEKIWGRGETTGVPRNVLHSAERLRRELRPERGPVDWRPVIQRRRDAERRIEAVEHYARSSGCRRAGLVGYFGERLKACSGCDGCGKLPNSGPLETHDVALRLRRLCEALSRNKTPWGGCPLEPEVLRRLAESPPVDAAQLADVPGVGPALAAQLGGAILTGLGIETVSRPSEEIEGAQVSTMVALRNWRAQAARQMGVPAYLVLTDATLKAIAQARPGDRQELARIRGIGPRTLAKFSDDLLRIACEPSGLAAPNSLTTRLLAE